MIEQPADLRYSDLPALYLELLEFDEFVAREFGVYPEDHAVMFDVIPVDCSLGDHAWEDDGSYAGPESGYEAHRCKHCGARWEHIYY